MNVPTREVFGNVQPWMQALFYGMLLLSVGIFVARVIRRVRLWRKTQAGWEKINWRIGVSRLITYALAQKRVARKSLGAVAHLLLYSGFVVLTIGTTLLMISHAGPVDFHRGWYYLIYELIMDVFGVAFCLGCALAIYRRLCARPASLGHNRRDYLLLGVLLSIGLSGFLLEGLRLKYSQPDPVHAYWSVVGWAVDETLLRSISLPTAQTLHLVFWWFHAILVAGFIACIPITRMLHVITGTLHIALRSQRPMGMLKTISIEAVEETGLIGVSALEHFTGQQLLSFDACMECGRCEEACPAWATGKPLSPKALIVDLQNAMTQSGLENGSNSPAPLHGGTIAPETLWSCTMCQACVYECPVLIGHVDVISDMRRHLVGEGAITGSPAKALQQMASQGNPFGLPNAERTTWSDGLDIPTVESNPDFEYLLWVGCSAAFDPRSRKIARATAQLLIAAGVNFAILGDQEKCTGDTARRLGDEFLFQEMAQENISSLDYHRVKKVVTPCPHCLNTLGNEYSQFGGNYEVLHHSQLFAELIDDGKLEPVTEHQEPITLHDPCYLARVNGETDAQRKLLGVKSSAAGGQMFREMPRNGENTFCCGAGGGRVWFEEAPEQRVSRQRAPEALATGAKTLATACPFCLNMMTDGMAGVEGGVDVKVLDISEILIAAQKPRQS